MSLVGLRCMVMVFPDHTFIFWSYMYVIKLQPTGRYVIVSYRDLLEIMCREKGLTFSEPAPFVGNLCSQVNTS